MEADEFATARQRLWDELVRLQNASDEYDYLFSSKDRVDLLNRSARWFFGLVQRLLSREIVLAIGRITDETGTGRRTNLTLSLLLSDPRRASYPAVFAELAARIEALRTKADPVRQLRHKRIAHLDHAVALAGNSALLPKVPIELVHEVIREAEDIYNLHGINVERSEAYFHLRTVTSSARLVALLERGIKHEQAEFEQRLGRHQRPNQ